MFLYGYHSVREALRHRPHRLARVIVSAARGGRRRDEIEELCRRHRVPFAEVPERGLTAVAGPAHNGMAAELAGLGEGHPPSGASGAGDPGGAGAGGSAGTGGGAAAAGDPDLVVLLEDVQDPRNLGAVLRVCEAAGAGRVLIRDRGAAPITPAVVKTAAGATEWLAVERITNSATALESLKKDGFWAYATDPGGQLPWTVDLRGKVVLCFGGEERGLRPRTRSLCDAALGLPMRGHVGSLNISTAAAAVLYEAVRQRLQAAAQRGGV